MPDWDEAEEVKLRNFWDRRRNVSLLLYKSDDRNFSSPLEHHWTLIIGELKEKAWGPDTLQNGKEKKNEEMGDSLAEKE